MKLKTLIAATSVLVLSALSASAAEKIRIVHGNPSFGLLQLYVAQVGGYFKEEGLEPEFIKTGSGAKTIAAVVGGAADVAVTSSSAALYAQQEGVDLVVFGALITGYHTPIVYSKEWVKKHGLTKESSLKDRLAALKGARIATTGPGGGDQIIRFYAKKAGLNPDRDLSILHLGSDLATFLVGMDVGRIDGFAVGAPNSLIAKREKGAMMALNPPEGEIEELNGFLYVSTLGLRSWIEKHPAEVKALARSFQKALDVIQDPQKGPALRDKVHAEYFSNVSKEIFAEAWEEAKVVSAKSFTVAPDALPKVASFVSMFDPLRLDDAKIAKASVEVKPDR